MSLGNDPTNTVSVEEAERKAAASEARAELLRDGPAPTTDAILEAMDQHDTRASRAARILLGYVDPEDPDPGRRTR